MIIILTYKKITKLVASNTHILELLRG